MPSSFQSSSDRLLKLVSGLKAEIFDLRFKLMKEMDEKQNLSRQVAALKSQSADCQSIDEKKNELIVKMGKLLHEHGIEWIKEFEDVGPYFCGIVGCESWFHSRGELHVHYLYDHTVRVFSLINAN